MPTVAIVSYPDIDRSDREWIESIRSRHDPQAAIVQAHFTLVFPVDVSPADLAVEVTAVAGLTAPIRFTIRSATAVRDVFGPGGHVFLVPDEGATEITGLHGQLYRGQLRGYLREDIPFVPHMTVAANPDFGWCQAFARKLSSELEVVTGEISRLDLVRVAGGRVESLGQFSMASGQEAR